MGFLHWRLYIPCITSLDDALMVPAKRQRTSSSELTLDDLPRQRFAELLTRLRSLPAGEDTARYMVYAEAAFVSHSFTLALKLSEEALALCWTALHTGPWKSVANEWRSAYMAAALICACSKWHRTTMATRASGCIENNEHLSGLRALDMGLMLGDLSLRPQLLRAIRAWEHASGNALSHQGAGWVSRPAAANATTTPRPLSGCLPTLQRMQLPSLAYFFNECMQPGRPAILCGVIDSWPALTTRPWSDLGYLDAVIGHRTVPIEFGTSYLDEHFDERLMTFHTFMEEHLERPAPPLGAPRGYLAQHQLFEQCEQLRRDVVIPDYCALSVDDEQSDGNEEEVEAAAGGGASPSNSAASQGIDGVRVNAWFGPAGTLSPLHCDRYHNLFCQVVGSKYVRLYAPEHAARLYPHESGAHAGVSSRIIDPDDTTTCAAFPELASAPYVDVLLHAGDVLFIPRQWWHMVESREVSMSVSFWWL